MEDNLIEILSTFGVPVIRQGSMAEDEAYPPTFFTFWNLESPDHAYYDNQAYGTSWSYQVCCYSDDPQTTYDLLMQARRALLAASYICPSKGYDVRSDEVTHTGRGMDIIYFER